LEELWRWDEASAGTVGNRLSRSCAKLDLKPIDSVDFKASEKFFPGQFPFRRDRL